MSKLKLLVASLLVGSLFAPVTLGSVQSRDAVQYTSNAMACTQTAATTDVSATSPTMLNFFNTGSNEVFLLMNGSDATTTTGVQLDPGQAYSVSLRDNFFRSISCICSSSETTTVRVGGHR